VIPVPQHVLLHPQIPSVPTQDLRQIPARHLPTTVASGTIDKPSGYTWSVVLTEFEMQTSAQLRAGWASELQVLWEEYFRKDGSRVPVLVGAATFEGRRGGGLMVADVTVFVVEDDASLRASLQDLLQSVGLPVVAFASTQEFLRRPHPDVPGCLVLDVRLPGLSGLELQKQLAAVDRDLPIIFITGHGDIPMSVQAMKAEAVEFLTKPFRDQALLDAIQQALARDRQAREQRAQREALRRRYGALTPREREVMARVVAGLLNKQIAAELGTSEASVKVYRQHVMEKMEAGSLAALVRMADRLGIPTPPS
jgi:FixJ family two-component response regulator